MKFKVSVPATISFEVEADSQEEGAHKIAGTLMRIQSDVCVGDKGVSFYATITDPPDLEEVEDPPPAAWYDEQTGMYKGVDND